jgi:hypothetical protein
MKSTRRVRPKKRTRRGGRVIGSGEYGFVIDPPIQCVGKDTTGYVSKVFESSMGATSDALLRNVKSNPVFAKIREIEEYDKYFTPIEDFEWEKYSWI